MIILNNQDYYSDHVSLQVGEGGQVKEVLEEVRRAGLTQPQKHGVSVLQQEHAGVRQALLRTAQRSGQSLAADVQVVLETNKKPLVLPATLKGGGPVRTAFLPAGRGAGRAAAVYPPRPSP